jgi:hypothetical protein
MIAGFAANLAVSYFILKDLCHCEGVQPTEAIRSVQKIAASPAKALTPRNDTKIVFFVLVIIETLIHGMIFMKTALPANFYPAEPALTFLQNKYTGDQGRVFTYGDNLLPNIGTWYHINELNDHDTIYLTSNKQLKTNVANYNYSPEYTFDEPNLKALRFLSVKYLLYPPKEGREELEKFSSGLFRCKLCSTKPKRQPAQSLFAKRIRSR